VSGPSLTWSIGKVIRDNLSREYGSSPFLRGAYHHPNGGDKTQRVAASLPLADLTEGNALERPFFVATSRLAGHLDEIGARLDTRGSSTCRRQEYNWTIFRTCLPRRINGDGDGQSLHTRLASTRLASALSRSKLTGTLQGLRIPALRRTWRDRMSGKEDGLSCLMDTSEGSVP